LEEWGERGNDFIPSRKVGWAIIGQRLLEGEERSHQADALGGMKKKERHSSQKKNWHADSVWRQGKEEGGSCRFCLGGGRKHP